MLALVDANGAAVGPMLGRPQAAAYPNAVQPDELDTFYNTQLWSVDAGTGVLTPTHTGMVRYFATGDCTGQVYMGVGTNTIRMSYDAVPQTTLTTATMPVVGEAGGYHRVATVPSIAGADLFQPTGPSVLISPASALGTTNNPTDNTCGSGGAAGYYMPVTRTGVVPPDLPAPLVLAYR